jgi:Nif-specific regulatory protein
MAGNFPSLHPRYELHDRLGEGGMSSIYKALDLLDQKWIAVKYSETAESDRTFFLREFEILCRLHHPHLPSAYDLYLSKDSSFFTMKWVEGRDLRTMIRSKQSITPDFFYSTFIQLLSALQYCHNHGIVHYDVKPENIILHEAGAGLSVQLIDFGLAQYEGEPAEYAKGTIQYSSPEMIKKEKTDRRSDLYALGVVMYELAAGFNPFDDENVVNVVVNHLEKKITDVQTPYSFISDGIKNIILKLLVKDPQYRYQNVEEIYRDIRSVEDLQGRYEPEDGFVLNSCFVHRVNEINKLKTNAEEFMSDANNPDARILWISGGDGTGKSALLRELKLHLQKQGYPAVPLGLRSSSRHDNLRRFIQLLQFRPETDSYEVSENAQQWIMGTSDLFSDRAENLISELTDLAVKLMPSRSPLILLMDPWENLNDFEAEFFDRLFRILRQRPVVKILFYLVSGRQENAFVRLENFDRKETGTFIGSLLNDPSVSDEIVETLYVSSRGNPFFIETTLAHLIRKGNLVREGEWKLDSDRIGSIPSSIHDFIALKLKGLEPDTGTVLAAASIFPQAFTLEELQIVCADRDAERKLLYLTRNGFIESSGGAFSVTSSYLKDTVLQTVSTPEREAAHLKLAHYYESKDGTRNAAALAHHFFYSPQKMRALPYLMELGQSRLNNFLPKDALRCFSDAAAILRVHDDGNLLDTLFKIEALYDRLGRRPEQESIINEILETAKSQSDYSNLLRGLLRKANFLEKTSQFDESQRVCKEAINFSETTGGGIFLGPLHRQLGRAFYNRAAWDKALIHYKTAYEHALREGDKKLEMECLNSLGTVYGSMDNYAGAKEYFLRTIELSERLGDAERKVNAVYNVARLAYKTNDLDEALMQLQHASDILKGLKNKKLEQLIGQQTALIYFAMHQYETAFNFNERVLSLSFELNDRTAVGRALANQAMIFLRLGLNKLCMTNLESSLEYAVHLDNKKDIHNRRLYLAEMHILEKQWTIAVRYATEAIEYFSKNKNEELLLFAKLTLLRIGIESNFKAINLPGIEIITGRLNDLVTDKLTNTTPSLRIEALHLLSKTYRISGELAKSIRYSQDAIELLETQKYYEFNRTELYYNHYLTVLGANTPRAVLGHFLEKAYWNINEIENGLKRSDFKTAFMNLPLNQEVVNEYKLFFNEEREFDIRSFQILYEITKDINSILETEKLFDRIMDNAIENTKSDRGLILIKSELSESFDVKVARNIDQETLSDLTPISQSIVQEVYQTGQSIVTADANQDDRFKSRKSIVAYNIRSIMCVPLRIKDAIIGAVYVDKQFDTHYFSPRNLRFLESFANIAGIAIENARLYEKLNLEKEDLSKENIDLKFEIQEKYTKYNIVGRSKTMKQIFRIIEAAAENPANVLIQGESGTGKELVAKAIHYNGSRKNKKFVAVDCGALPENLLESELFGYKKGAFTGATSDKKGLFEEADGGTIFLDEITNTSLNFQSRLLRVIQESEIRRVGDTETRKINVRFVAATNRNLQEQVKSGAFREDLYYRINVIVVNLPPLRERKEDIPLLVQYIIEKQNKNIKSVRGELMERLVQYDWPGNIRELENVLSRMMLFAEKETLTAENLPEEIGVHRKPKTAPAISAAMEMRQPDRTLDEFEAELMDKERIYFKSILDSVEGNKSKAAEKLGIKRTTLNDRLKKLGL